MMRIDFLSFLKEHQPLPDDTSLTQETIDMYDQARKWFLENPDPICIPLFLNSFGKGSGFGVYQLVVDVLKKHPASLVIPHLRKVLTKGQDCLLSWNCEIACEFPDSSLVNPLGKLLKHCDSDIRSFAIQALEQVFINGNKDAFVLLQEARKSEQDEDNLELLEDILDI